MSELWPRLSKPVAQVAFEGLAGTSVRDLVAVARHSHLQETYAATGGVRVSVAQISELSKKIRLTAAEFGYPDASSDDERIAFDRAAAEVIYEHMQLTTVEAANRGVWSFVAVVVLPDVTQWRFGRNNQERWIASDLTRHMFSRLWWQALTFAASSTDGSHDYSLLQRLTESDLNQITERRTIGGNVGLSRALARVVIGSDGARRELIRAITPRLRRRLAFIDFSALTDEQIEDHIRSLL